MAFVLPGWFPDQSSLYEDSVVKNWNNAATELRPFDVARSYLIHSPLSPDLKGLGYRALDLFGRGEIKAAKAVLEAGSAVEFDGGREYLLWAQFKALFIKSSLKGRLKDQEAAAWSKFLAAERACKRANRRLRYYWSRPDRENPIYRVIFSRARQLIRDCLGNFTDTTLESLLAASRPGGGSAIGTLDFRRVTPAFKFDLNATKLVCTTSAIPYATALVLGSPAWLRCAADVDWASYPSPTVKVPYEVANHNRVAHVPKDASTTRTIAVEPSLNVCLQLGAAELIARRLRRVGIDVACQTFNQNAARRGASDWLGPDPLVTIDLSAASDSVSIALVERLLPSDWFGVLSDLRSPAYRLGKGDPVPYQKWSSMGNGYTFVLETLIFWALARATASLLQGGDEVWVYGDDIAVNRSTSFLLIEVLRYAGFRTNTDKTFLFGPFRESCGDDWWGSDRVVPVYLRHIDVLRLTDIYRVANHLAAGLPPGFSADLLRAHRGQRVLRGPPGPDSSRCWFAPLENIPKTQLRWSREWQCYRHEAAVYKPNHWRVTPAASYVASLLGAQHVHDFPRSTLRGRGKWTTSWVACG